MTSSSPGSSFEIFQVNISEKGVVVIVISTNQYFFVWCQTKIESQKYPGFTNAVELLEHCHQIGAGGIQTVVREWTGDFSKKLRERREKLGLYLEGSIGSPSGPEDISRFEQEVIHAKEAGAVILRTVTSGGRRYEVWRSSKDVQDFKTDFIRTKRCSYRNNYLLAFYCSSVICA